MLLIVVAIVLFCGVYSAWFTIPFQRIYLKLDGKKVFSGQTLVLGDVTFDVRKTFGGKYSDYSVRVIPEGDFTFVKNGDFVSLAVEVPEVTSFFDIEVEESQFSIYCHNVTWQEVLEQAFPYDDVSVTGSADVDAHFKLVVTDLSNEKLVVEIPFACSLSVQDIELPPSILF